MISSIILGTLFIKITLDDNNNNIKLQNYEEYGKIFNVDCRTLDFYTYNNNNIAQIT